MSTDEPQKPLTPILKLDLKDNGGEFHFYTEDEMIAWLRAEVQIWSFAESGGELSNALTRFIERNRKDDDPRNSFKATIESLFMGASPYPHSKSRLGQLILSLPDSDRRIGWTLVKHKVFAVGQLRLEKSAFITLFRIIAFEVGFDSSQQENAALHALRTKWEVELIAQSQSFEDQTKACNKLRTELEDQKKAATSEAVAAKKLHADMTADHATSMAEIQRKYEIELAVRSAVNHWTRMARNHRDSARMWGYASVVYGAASFIGILVLHWLFSGVPENIQKLIDDGTILAADVPTVILRSSAASVLGYIPLALLLVWPLRILIRNYLSSSHLAADATERAMLVRTYVALVNDPDVSKGDKLKEQVLPPALASVFRHAADGIVRDDGMPLQTLIDSIKKTT